MRAPVTTVTCAVVHGRRPHRAVSTFHRRHAALRAVLVAGRARARVSSVHEAQEQVETRAPNVAPEAIGATARMTPGEQGPLLVTCSNCGRDAPVSLADREGFVCPSCGERGAMPAGAKERLARAQEELDRVRVEERRIGARAAALTGSAIAELRGSIAVFCVLCLLLYGGAIVNGLAHAGGPDLPLLLGGVAGFVAAGSLSFCASIPFTRARHGAAPGEPWRRRPVPPLRRAAPEHRSLARHRGVRRTAARTTSSAPTPCGASVACGTRASPSTPRRWRVGWFPLSRKNRNASTSTRLRGSTITDARAA
jgi:hypothetical protein